MDFGEVVGRRRMVRSYLDVPLPPGSLERIVAAALSAPSAGFAQGQSLVVITDASQRSRIAAAGNEQEYVEHGLPPWLSLAPVHIVVTVSEQAYVDRYRETDKLGPDMEKLPWDVPYWWVDGGTTMMAILLAATNEGLAAGFQGNHNFDGLGAVLDIPESEKPLGVITIGFAAPDDRARGSVLRGRRPPTDTVHYDRW
ncbi:MAG: nitroreductase [Actinobacteria bacterium]|nr:nitroreductase [Actinomycetota bacterium]